MVLTCTALRSDSTKFHANRMTRFLEMLKSMAITTDATKLLTSAAKRATGKTKPEIFFEVAFVTMSETWEIGIVYGLSES